MGKTEGTTTMNEPATAEPHPHYRQAREAEDAAAQATGAEADAAWKKVLQLYQATTKAEPDHADGFYRLGLVHKRRKDWGAAAQSFKRAVELRPDHEEGHFQRGLVLHLANRKKESKQSYHAGLDLNPDNPAFLRSMLDMESRDFGHRLRTGRFVAERLTEIQQRAAASRQRILPALERPVFMYWGQGYGSAPPVVRACVAQAQEVVPSDRLHLLDGDNWRYYGEVPAKLVERQHTDPTQFSDNLRLSLLSRYGGVWVDATCYLRPDALTTMDELAQLDLFAHRYVGPRISSWFLTARPAGYIVSLMEATMQLFWETNDVKRGYFMFHDMFESLYWADPRMQKLWDDNPPLSSHPPHVLQQTMFDDGDSHRLDELVHAHFVHKLSHKYPLARVSPDSLLAALVRRPAGLSR